jgi:hypothetical protein
MCELLINIIGTVIGGIILAIVLFLFNERFKPMHNLSGEWQITTTTENTPHRTFQNMILDYKFHLLQKGHEIIGSGEKIKEKTSDGKSLEYPREDRIPLKISGYYERNFLKASKVYLNIVEDGQKRKSRTTYILTVKSKTILGGNFISTAADATGQIKMVRT